MKNVMMILVALFLVACGKNEVEFKEVRGDNGYNSLLDFSRSSIDSMICESEMGNIVNAGLDYNENNVLDNDEISKTTVICDGTNGQDGEDGQDGIDGEDGDDAPVSQFDIVEVIDPCGDEPGKADEVLFVLRNGDIVAWYKNLGLSILDVDKKYRTTDVQKCLFEIDSNGNYIEL